MILGLAYVATLAAGFSSLETPQQSVDYSMFAMMEMLIMLMIPAMYEGAEIAA